MNDRHKYQSRLTSSVDAADRIGMKVGAFSGKISWKIVITIITVITILFLGFIQFCYGFGKGFKKRSIN